MLYPFLNEYKASNGFIFIWLNILARFSICSFKTTNELGSVDISAQPDETSHKGQEPKKSGRELIESGKDTPIPLDFVDLIGDKIYNDAELEDRLWRKRSITLLPLRKCSQKKQWIQEVWRILGNIRHRVEAVFSTVTTVFKIQRPRGRSLAGHVVRIATCILAHTLSFFMT